MRVVGAVDLSARESFVSKDLAWGHLNEKSRSGSIFCTMARQTTCSYPGHVIMPRDSSPGTNGPSSRTRNHSPNSRYSVSARQTRDAGALSTIRFSIWLAIQATYRLHNMPDNPSAQPSSFLSSLKKMCEEIYSRPLRPGPPSRLPPQPPPCF